jgi:hypothetical protein
MAPFTIETVTIIAGVIIGVILAIYLIVLRRMGWLGGNDKFYRCPNPGCKKIFRNPAKVKDLSETHAKIRNACPECGTDIEPYLKTGAIHITRAHKTSTEANPTPQATPKPIYLKQKPEMQQTPQQSAPKPTYLKQKSETQSATPKPVYLNQKPETPPVTPKPVSLSQKSEQQPATPKQIQIKEPQPKQTDQTIRSATMGDNSKTTNSSECRYYFGYLANREKNESIPETCLDCPKSLDCMLSNHELKNSVQEIKKWYPSKT